MRVALHTGPARAPLLSDGAADRIWKGRKAWVAPVQSSSLVVFKTGVMPMGRLRVVQSSCIQAAVRLGFTMFWWSEPLAGGLLAGVPPPNKLAGSSYLVLCLILPCFSLSHHGDGQEEEIRMGLSHRFIYVSSWSPIFAASGKGIWCKCEPPEDFTLCCCILWSKGNLSEYRR